MSELQHALELFEILSIEDVTVNSLKKAFKTHIVKGHPDRGGNSELFDQMLNSYIYLMETVQRVSGGRTTLQNIVTPDELKEMRPDEFVNRFFEEYHNDKFNELFDEQNKKELHGYSSWLKSNEGEFGDATQKPPSFESKDLNIVFENATKEGKPETSSIILHPEQMAYVSEKNIGTDIIESTEEGYTSNTFTDLYSAFTKDNIIYDKIPIWTDVHKTIDEITDERKQDILPLNNTELEAIYEYERIKFESNINNSSKVKEYFQSNDINHSKLIDSNNISEGFIIQFEK